MELNDLRIFVTVASKKSISKAATSLGYAQSNVSMRIKVLEEELKIRLFNRTAKGSELTREGRKLLIYANQIGELIDKINAEFVTKSENKTIKIGAPQTILASILPSAIVEFKGKLEEIQFNLIALGNNKLGQALNLNEIDIAFLYNDCKTDHRVIGQIVEEAVLILPPKYKMNSVTNIPIIVNSDPTCPYRKIGIEWIYENHRQDREVLYFDTLESIVNSVRAGIGISVIPKSLAKNYHDLEFQRILEINTEINISIVIPKNRTKTDLYMSFVETLISIS